VSTVAEKVVVVGAGTMGAGIAQVAAQAGCQAVAVDRPEALSTARSSIERFLDGSVVRGKLSDGERAETLGRLGFAENLDETLPADIVIEAVYEDEAVKRDVFSKVPSGAAGLVLTNTSSLSVDRLARHAADPSRFLGLHFFNPVPLMSLVEVVRGAATSEAALAETLDFARRLGKRPVVVADSPGFIVNRVARPYYLEALRLLGDGIAPMGEIDEVLEGRGFRMGPFRLMDLVGIDVNYAVSRSVYEQMVEEPRLRPHPIQRRMVEAGLLGRKTGRGFYRYG